MSYPKKGGFTMILNTHPTNRKEMVKAISELPTLESSYMGIP